MTDVFFEMAEREYLDPDRAPRYCPVCGSIDISAGGICRHCGTNIEMENTYENQL